MSHLNIQTSSKELLEDRGFRTVHDLTFQRCSEKCIEVITISPHPHISHVYGIFVGIHYAILPDLQLPTVFPGETDFDENLLSYESCLFEAASEIDDHFWFGSDELDISVLEMMLRCAESMFEPFRNRWESPRELLSLGEHRFRLLNRDTDLFANAEDPFEAAQEEGLALQKELFGKWAPRAYVFEFGVAMLFWLLESPELSSTMFKILRPNEETKPIPKSVSQAWEKLSHLVGE